MLEAAALVSRVGRWGNRQLTFIMASLFYNSAQRPCISLLHIVCDTRLNALIIFLIFLTDKWVFFTHNNVPKIQLCAAIEISR
jgi:hypothetical protein